MTIFFLGESIRAEKTLALAKSEGIPILEINLLKNPLTGTQIEDLATLPGLKIIDLVNKEHPYFLEHFDHDDFNERDWLTIMEKNPKIIKQPIVLRGNKSLLIETPTDILKLFKN